MMSFKQWVLNIIFRHREEDVIIHELPCNVHTDRDSERVNALALRMRCKDMPVEVVFNRRTKEWMVFTNHANVKNARLQLLAEVTERQIMRRVTHAS